MGSREKPAKMKMSLIFLVCLLLAFSQAQFDDIAQLDDMFDHYDDPQGHPPFAATGICTANPRTCTLRKNKCNERIGFLADVYFTPPGDCCCKCCKGPTCGPINCGRPYCKKKMIHK